MFIPPHVGFSRDGEETKKQQKHVPECCYYGAERACEAGPMVKLHSIPSLAITTTSASVSSIGTSKRGSCSRSGISHILVETPLHRKIGKKTDCSIKPPARSKCSDQLPQQMLAEQDGLAQCGFSCCSIVPCQSCQKLGVRLSPAKSNLQRAPAVDAKTSSRCPPSIDKQGAKYPR